MILTVFVLQRDCGDYYCGCGGGHIVGVFESREDLDSTVGRFGREWSEKYERDCAIDWRVTEILVGEARWTDDLMLSDLHAWT